MPPKSASAATQTRLNFRSQSLALAAQVSREPQGGIAHHIILNLQMPAPGDPMG